jgi:hypothetical protein
MVVSGYSDLKKRNPEQWWDGNEGEEEEWRSEGGV